jgi:hypothetical protein
MAMLFGEVTERVNFQQNLNGKKSANLVLACGDTRTSYSIASPNRIFCISM